MQVTPSRLTVCSLFKELKGAQNTRRSCPKGKRKRISRFKGPVKAFKALEGSFLSSRQSNEGSCHRGLLQRQESPATASFDRGNLLQPWMSCLM